MRKENAELLEQRRIAEIRINNAFSLWFAGARAPAILAALIVAPRPC